eukprot:3931863-Rhodomonas_salina.1
MPSVFRVLAFELLLEIGTQAAPDSVPTSWCLLSLALSSLDLRGNCRLLALRQLLVSPRPLSGRRRVVSYQLPQEAFSVRARPVPHPSTRTRPVSEPDTWQSVRVTRQQCAPWGRRAGSSLLSFLKHGDQRRGRVLLGQLQGGFAAPVRGKHVSAVAQKLARNFDVLGFAPVCGVVQRRPVVPVGDVGVGAVR